MAVTILIITLILTIIAYIFYRRYMQKQRLAKISKERRYTFKI